MLTLALMLNHRPNPQSKPVLGPDNHGAVNASKFASRVWLKSHGQSQRQGQGMCYDSNEAAIQ